MGITLANNAHTTLSADASSTDTTIYVEDIDSFPTLGVGDYFYLTLERTSGAMEIVKVTQINASSFTVVRGQENTVPISFAIGSRVDLRVTVGSLEDKIDDAVEAHISDTAYASSWNGVTTIAPSKNVVYDKIEGLSSVYQPLDADLTTLGAGGTGARDFLGLGTGNTPQFTGVELSDTSANTLTGYAGDAFIEGNRLFRAGGTDVPTADGGTGASNANDAMENYLDTGTFTATSTTTARSLIARFSDILNLRDFGAAGDGVTNDTTAVQAWIDACRNNAKVGFAPDGDYLCDALTFGPLVQANTPGLYGTDANTCRFIKRTNNTDPLITFNSVGATTYLAGMTIQNIGFVGLSSGPVVRSYSMARCEFAGCEITGGSIGSEQFGGIGVQYTNCGIHNNGINIKLRKYTAAVGTGYPNLTVAHGGYITSATTTNIDFDDGKRFELHGVDIEGAVTNIVVGPNIGSEDSVEGYGVLLFGGWLEAATGSASVTCASGLNVFIGVDVAANSSTVDFSFTGGRYVLRDITGPTTKTTAVSEGGAIGAPNYIENVKLGGAITVDGAKTYVVASNNLHTQLAGMIKFLGATSSFPALKRSGTTLQVRLADDSANAPLAAASLALDTALSAANGGTGLTALGTNVATFLNTPSSANLLAALTDETGTGANVFATSPTLTTPVISGVACFGGATSAFPGLKRQGSTQWLAARLADDSGYCPVIGQLTTSASATTGLSAGAFAATTDATIVVYDATGQAYRVPCKI